MELKLTEKKMWKWNKGNTKGGGVEISPRGQWKYMTHLC